jgi:hypothetical protein
LADSHMPAQPSGGHDRIPGEQIVQLAARSGCEISQPGSRARGRDQTMYIGIGTIVIIVVIVLVILMLRRRV